MPSATDKALALLSARVGVESPPGEWHTVTQRQIDAFADATLDRQFIHVDPARAAQTHFGSTVAHGFLTLSLMVHLVQNIPRGEDDPMEERVMGVNYGLDRVRFPSPVPVNSRVRARQTLLGVEKKDDHTLQLTHRVSVEIEGRDKPACVAEWIGRAIFA